jgi:hypothetical protein
MVAFVLVSTYLALLSANFPLLLVIFSALFLHLATIFAPFAAVLVGSRLGAHTRPDAEKHGRDSNDGLHGALLC